MPADCLADYPAADEENNPRTADDPDDVFPWLLNVREGACRGVMTYTWSYDPPPNSPIPCCRSDFD